MTPTTAAREQGPPGDAWARIRREIAQLAGQPSITLG